MSKSQQPDEEMRYKKKIKKREKERNAITDYREKMFGLLIDQASGIKKKKWLKKWLKKKWCYIRIEKLE